MFVINSRYDIQKLRKEGNVSVKLAKHIEAKIERLKDILEPNQDIDSFVLEKYGNIGLFEAADKDFKGIGVEEVVKNIIPEWIGKISLADEKYYLIYLISNNDSVIQIYLPEKLVKGELSEWINKQDIDDEKVGGEDVSKYNVPF